ncbi:MAG: DUF4338 domain-containing protein [Planctomycetia bacterium]|nr:DUF4338 domain-containing protein [Planctomycetia bacterium]
MPGDWEDAYKVTPVLVETYVEKGRYEGTCYKASNWEYLGETQGRGRNDRYHQNRLSRKHVFAYELEEGILDAGREEREYKDWVEEELQDVRLPNLTNGVVCSCALPGSANGTDAVSVVSIPILENRDAPFGR